MLAGTQYAVSPRFLFDGAFDDNNDSSCRSPALDGSNNTVLPDGAVLIGSNGRVQAVGEAKKILDANPGVR